MYVSRLLKEYICNISIMAKDIKLKLPRMVDGFKKKTKLKDTSTLLYSYIYDILGSTKGIEFKFSGNVG